MRLEYSPGAEKFIRKLAKKDPQSAELIAVKAAKLADDPEPAGSLKLKGYQKEYRRIRAGRFRVVYCVEDGAVKIAEVEVRPEAFRKFKRRGG